MKYISICSGIEAATVAFHGFGWTPLAFSEIEAFPSAVLAARWPDVPNLGDMTKFAEWPEELLAECDLLVGGPPCQAFSVAGLRKSLDDDRGNITLAYVRLLNHIDEVRKRHGRPPATAVYENVPGLLSTKDNAFGCLIGALCGCDEAPETETGKWPKAGFLCGETRRVGYRVLDAQYFGVAQRRRRIFLVAVPGELVERLGERACPSEILSLRESVRGNPPTRRKAWEGAAAGAAVGTGVGREPCYLDRAAFNQGENAQYDPQITQDGVAGSMVARGPAAVGVSGQVSGTLDANYFKGCGSAAFGEREVVAVPQAFGGNKTSGPLDVATSCLAHGGPHGRQDFASETFVCHGADPFAFKPSHFTRGKDGKPDSATPPLSADADKGDQDIVIFTGDGVIADPISAHEARTYTHEGTTFRLHNCVGQGVCATGEKTHALTTRSAAEEDGTGRGTPIVPAVAFSAKDYGGDATVEVSPTMRAMHHLNGNANAGGQIAVAVDTYNQTIGDTSIPVRVGNAKDSLPAVMVPAVAFKPGQSEAAGGTFVTEEFAPTVQAQNNGSTAVPAVAYVKATNPHSKEEAPRFEEAGVAACLNGWDERHDPPKHIVAFKESQSGVRVGDVHATIDANKGSRRQEGVVAFAQNQLGEVRVNADVMGTVNTNQNASGRNTPMVQSAMQVRRLTPTECCRLQGFPDDHCDIVFRKKPAADGPKYRALGNSMAVPCMAWLGHRIHEATK